MLPPLRPQVLHPASASPPGPGPELELGGAAELGGVLWQAALPEESPGSQALVTLWPPVVVRNAMPCSVTLWALGPGTAAPGAGTVMLAPGAVSPLAVPAAGGDLLRVSLVRHSPLILSSRCRRRCACPLTCKRRASGCAPVQLPTCPAAAD